MAATTRIGELMEVARAERERWHVPGLAVGVLRDGEVETFADGVASLETGEPVRPEMRFRVASISKPFTASLALSLVQDGLLSLDESLRGGHSARVLLSHSSGLSSEWPEPLDGAGDDDGALERLLASREPAPGPAGSAGLFSYCNSGFWIVATEIAQRTGMSFEVAMAERILAPLGLRSTAYEADGDVAAGHAQVTPGADEHRVESSAYPRVRRASGGLFSSVGDLLRFADHHLGGPGPLTAESISAMQQPQVEYFGGAYGIGWTLRKACERRIVEHSGSAAGYQSLLLLVPDERFAFAALTNSSRGSAAIRGIAEALGVAEDEPPVLAAAPTADGIAGTYRIGRGDEALVTAGQDGSICVDFTETNPFTGERESYPTVVAQPIGDGVFQVREGEERGMAIESLDGGRLVRFGWTLFERAAE